MSQFYYIDNRVKLIHEPDDFDMSEPEPTLSELYEAQIAADTRDCVEDIFATIGELERKCRRQAS